MRKLIRRIQCIMTFWLNLLVPNYIHLFFIPTYLLILHNFILQPPHSIASHHPTNHYFGLPSSTSLIPHLSFDLYSFILETTTFDSSSNHHHSLLNSPTTACYSSLTLVAKSNTLVCFSVDATRNKSIITSLFMQFDTKYIKEILYNFKVLIFT